MRIVGPAVLVLLCLAPWSSGAAPARPLVEDAKKSKEAKQDKSKDGKTFEIPYKFTAAKHIVVRAKINGKGPFNFVLDTGAPALFVAVPVGKKAKVKTDEDGWGDLDKFEIEGGLVIPKVRARIETPFQLEGMNGLGLAGLEIHGLMGYDILAKYRMTFDFTTDKLVFTELDYKPEKPFSMRGKVGKGGIGGLEVMGQVMKLLGAFLGRKATPDLSVRGFFGMSLNDKDGVVVDSVLEKGPADKAGLRKGDIVTEIGGEKVSKVLDVVSLASKVKVKESLELKVKRGNQTKDITIESGEGF